MIPSLTDLSGCARIIRGTKTFFSVLLLLPILFPLAADRFIPADRSLFFCSRPVSLLFGSITTFPYSVAVAMSSISNCIPPCYILVVDVVIDAALSASRFPNNKAVHQYDTKVDIVL